jgi:citrate lyase subunit beta / citryl-CoA lyase
MRKSLQLQSEMAAEFGACVFDVTLDCEDGAPVGGESEHAALVTELALGAPAGARVAVRVHPVDHPHFDADVATIAGRAGDPPVPPDGAQGRIGGRCAARRGGHGRGGRHRAAAACADRVAGCGAPGLRHRGPPAGAVAEFWPDGLCLGPRRGHSGVGHGLAGQFSHPLVLRAKLEMAAACHAHGKVPSHNVVTEFKDLAALQAAAQKAAPNWATPACGASTPTRSGPSWRLCATDRGAKSGRAVIHH